MITLPPRPDRPHWSWCRVCGTFIPLIEGDQDAGRCSRHWDRNPCAIEGCERSRTVPESRELRLDQWMCSEHWRRFCPPRSKRRRAYHAFWRVAKKTGWTPKLERQFWRFWDTLISSARAKANVGTINKSEIAKMFGWTDAD